jgi:hypothetical protein
MNTRQIPQPPHPIPISVPRKSSLLFETLLVIRDGIQAGRWIDRIPSERELATDLQVSRPTVRTALRVLQTEGRVKIAQGRRTLILDQPKNFSSPVNRNLVALLSPVPMDQIRPAILLRINDLRIQFHQAGVAFHVYVRPRCFNTQPDSMLQLVVNEVRAKCWILIQTTREIQEWFASNQVPVVISGTTYDGIKIPCVDIDQFAICRHAVGLFRNRGHSRIAFLLRESGLAGDEAASAGFTTLCSRDKTETDHPIIYHFKGGRDQITKVLESTAFIEHDPTAILVGGSFTCLALITHLQQIGKQIPKDVAIVCRTSDMFFDYLTPSIASYSRLDATMERAIFKNCMEVLRGESLGKRRKLLMPDFIPGESLGLTLKRP